MEEFEGKWKLEAEISGYSRKFVEFCASKTLPEECKNVEEKISDGSFSRFTFDTMLAWEIPSSENEESRMVNSLSSYISGYHEKGLIEPVS